MPKAVFPVVGPARYISDFGAPRSQGAPPGQRHHGVRWAPAVAVEGGTVEFDSGGWGCMLYLYGDSGTKYVYIHLNNDLTMKNDNRGKCVPGVAFAKGLKSGQRVESGQHVAYVGDSGDADGIQPHLHFERHPRRRRRHGSVPLAQPAAAAAVHGAAGAAGQPGAARNGRLDGRARDAASSRLQTVKPWPDGAARRPRRAGR